MAKSTMQHRAWLALACGILALGPHARGEDEPSPSADLSMLRAVLQAPERLVAVGKPIWMDFSIVNDSDRPVTLAAPGVRAERPGLLAGLLSGVWLLVLPFLIIIPVIVIYLGGKRLGKAKEGKPIGYYDRLISLRKAQYGLGKAPFVIRAGYWSVRR